MGHIVVWTKEFQCTMLDVIDEISKAEIHLNCSASSKKYDAQPFLELSIDRQIG
jgi:hypothetical protein